MVHATFIDEHTKAKFSGDHETGQGDPTSFSGSGSLQESIDFSWF